MSPALPVAMMNPDPAAANPAAPSFTPAAAAAVSAGAMTMPQDMNESPMQPQKQVSTSHAAPSSTQQASQCVYQQQQQPIFSQSMNAEFATPPVAAAASFTGFPPSFSSMTGQLDAAMGIPPPPTSQPLFSTFSGPVNPSLTSEMLLPSNGSASSSSASTAVTTGAGSLPASASSTSATAATKRVDDEMAALLQTGHVAMPAAEALSSLAGKATAHRCVPPPPVYASSSSATSSQETLASQKAFSASSASTASGSTTTTATTAAAAATAARRRSSVTAQMPIFSQAASITTPVAHRPAPHAPAMAMSFTSQLQGPSSSGDMHEMGTHASVAHSLGSSVGSLPSHAGSALRTPSLPPASLSASSVMAPFTPTTGPLADTSALASSLNVVEAFLAHPEGMDMLTPELCAPSLFGKQPQPQPSTGRLDRRGSLATASPPQTAAPLLPSGQLGTHPASQSLTPGPTPGVTPAMTPLSQTPVGGSLHAAATAAGAGGMHLTPVDAAMLGTPASSCPGTPAEAMPPAGAAAPSSMSISSQLVNPYFAPQPESSSPAASPLLAASWMNGLAFSPQGSAPSSGYAQGAHPAYAAPHGHTHPYQTHGALTHAHNNPNVSESGAYPFMQHHPTPHHPYANHASPGLPQQLQQQQQQQQMPQQLQQQSHGSSTPMSYPSHSQASRWPSTMASGHASGAVAAGPMYAFAAPTDAKPIINRFPTPPPRPATAPVGRRHHSVDISAGMMPSPLDRPTPLARGATAAGYPGFPGAAGAGQHPQANGPRSPDRSGPLPDLTRKRLSISAKGSKGAFKPPGPPRRASLTVLTPGGTALSSFINGMAMGHPFAGHHRAAGYTRSCTPASSNATSQEPGAMLRRRMSRDAAAEIAEAIHMGLSINGSGTTTPGAASNMAMLRSITPLSSTGSIPERPSSALSNVSLSSPALIASQGPHGSPAVPPSLGEDYRQYKCPKPLCTKAYKNTNGLKYHLERGLCELDVEIAPVFADANGEPSPFGSPFGSQGMDNDNAAVAAAANIKLTHRPYWCRAPGCRKKYKNLNGLKYHVKQQCQHQQHQHQHHCQPQHPHHGPSAALAAAQGPFSPGGYHPGMHAPMPHTMHAMGYGGSLGELPLADVAEDPGQSHPDTMSFMRALSEPQDMNPVHHGGDGHHR
ncbi:hypothetical protein CXG81DRAFT_16271 [Caulochytrium protostelioides]|uniref:C2H2-type domain-containing protein n=1 Tax=Caulochytrium protostelioides TaxID=1555241 RepID=A0A4P9XFE3_9FUNG|nr:hypothetical protein CXG81DRAFT_16271 [Caulochytrium protostelioides]|eukprot:RKP04292.1 hypothetical protein CXG81DRAFT_16271 [Caulochytrium protostelioides]